jgi:hypothetical protein
VKKLETRRILHVRRIVNALIPKPGRGTVASASRVTKGTHTLMGVAKVRMYYTSTNEIVEDIFMYFNVFMYFIMIIQRIILLSLSLSLSLSLYIYIYIYIYIYMGVDINSSLDLQMLTNVRIQHSIIAQNIVSI